MTTDRELMQQALDALSMAVEPKKGKVYAFEFQPIDCAAMYLKAIEALRARLAQPEPEPVALGDSSYDVDFRDDGTISVSLPDGDELVIVPPQPKQKDLEPYCYTWDKWISSGTWEAQYGWKPYYGGKRPEHVTDAKPLYTAPPQREWIGLTENEIKHLWYEACQTNLELTSQLIVHLARNIEAKLKERNT